MLQMASTDVVLRRSSIAYAVVYTPVRFSQNDKGMNLGRILTTDAFVLSFATFILYCLSCDGEQTRHIVPITDPFLRLLKELTLPLPTALTLTY